MKTLTQGISRQNKCTVWQHNATQYTLKTSRNLWYYITSSWYKGEHSVRHERFYPSTEYIPNGKMLYNIPKQIMFHTLALQGVEK